MKISFYGRRNNKIHLIPSVSITLVDSDYWATPDRNSALLIAVSIGFEFLRWYMFIDFPVKRRILIKSRYTKIT